MTRIRKRMVRIRSSLLCYRILRLLFRAFFVFYLCTNHLLVRSYYTIPDNARASQLITLRLYLDTLCPYLFFYLPLLVNTIPQLS